MPKKSLQKQIEKKLDQLQELLDQMDEVRIIQEDDPDTWEPDILYRLRESCKELLKFLEDKKSKQLDEFN